MIRRFSGFRRNKGSTEAPRDLSVDEEREALALLHDYEESGLGWFWATDSRGLITYISSCAADTFGKETKLLLGEPLVSLFNLEPDGETETGRTLPLLLAAHKSFSDFRLRARSESDEVWWAISGRPQFDGEGEFLGFRGNGIDITAALREERDNKRLAKFDSLTGLANRHSMEQRLETTLTAFRGSQRSCALLMMDLDRFKQVNDTLGHPAGDALLKQVAERLTTLVGKQGDIGRLGGDEFQIIFPDFDDRGKLGDLAKQIISLISQPYAIDGARCAIGASIGIAIAPFDGNTSEDLVRNADLALYAAKEGGRGQFRFFSFELQANVEKRKVLQDDLGEALAADQIRLDFQPIVNATNNAVVAIETLMRWNHPEFGELPPSLFIPIAEESNLIIPLGEWALREACARAATWPENVSVTVNIASAQFSHSGFLTAITQAIASAGIAPERLELEFTESIFSADEDLARETFADLRRLGVRTTLDNFGSGYSPLAYLRNVHFDKIKIDRTLVQEMTLPGSRCVAIAAAITTLGKHLGITVTAAGIEARDELTFMRELGVDEVQGFIYSPPCAADEVLEAFASGHWVIEPDGPARQRTDRRSVYRRVGVIHEDYRYEVIMRNLSRGGAAIEGLADVPIGTEFVLDLGEGQLVVSVVRHSSGLLQGLEFESSLVDDGAGGLVTRHRVPRHLLEAMGMPTGGGKVASVIALNRAAGLQLPRFSTGDALGRGNRAA